MEGQRKRGFGDQRTKELVRSKPSLPSRPRFTKELSKSTDLIVLFIVDAICRVVCLQTSKAKSNSNTPSFHPCSTKGSDSRDRERKRNGSKLRQQDSVVSCLDFFFLFFHFHGLSTSHRQGGPDEKRWTKIRALPHRFNVV